MTGAERHTSSDEQTPIFLVNQVHTETRHSVSTLLFPEYTSKKKPKSSRSNGEAANVDEADEGGSEEGGKATVEVLLAVKWDLEKGIDPTGWWVSEKLDGVRYVHTASPLVCFHSDVLPVSFGMARGCSAGSAIRSLLRSGSLRVCHIYIF